MSEVNRSHPPSLRNIVKKTLLNECHLKKDCKILIGCSGGTDSQAALHVLSGLQKELNFKLFAVGIDHKLRKESADEIKMAKEFSESLGVPFYSDTVDVQPGNTQAQARAARYGVFYSYKKELNIDYIATAHHADDLAETVLMKIIKGSTAQELMCMSPLHDNRIKPLLRASKRDIDLHIKRKNIPVSQDPSNQNFKYLRSQIRHDIMPQLKNINPNIINALCKLSESVNC